MPVLPDGSTTFALVLPGNVVERPIVASPSFVLEAPASWRAAYVEIVEVVHDAQTAMTPSAIVCRPNGIEGCESGSLLQTRAPTADELAAALEVRRMRDAGERRHLRELGRLREVRIGGGRRADRAMLIAAASIRGGVVRFFTRP